MNPSNIHELLGQAQDQAARALKQLQQDQADLLKHSRTGAGSEAADNGGAICAVAVDAIGHTLDNLSRALSDGSRNESA